MKQLSFIQNQPGQLSLCVLGKTEDENNIAYQHFVMLLLADYSEDYRQGQGSELTKVLRGANISQQYLIAVARSACVTALYSMDQTQRAIIQSVQPQVGSLTGSLIIHMTFSNGAKITQAVL